MTLRFIPCSACARHVRGTDAACPFCGAAAPRPAPLPAAPRARLPRSALIAAGLAGSLAATDCSVGPAPQPAYGGTSVVTGDDENPRDMADAQVGEADAGAADSGAMSTGDGAPADAAADAEDVADAGDAGRDGGPFQVLYGAFAPDR